MTGAFTILANAKILNLNKKEMAYVAINCEHGFEQFIIHKLQSIDGVIEIQNTLGNYDIIIKIEAQSLESLRDLITWKIRKLEKIRSSTNLICIK